MLHFTATEKCFYNIVTSSVCPWKHFCFVQFFFNFGETFVIRKYKQ
jgi:hypothetical protein